MQYIAKAHRDGPNVGGIGYMQVPRFLEFEFDHDMSMTNVVVLASKCTTITKELEQKIVPNWLTIGYMVSYNVDTKSLDLVAWFGACVLVCHHWQVVLPSHVSTNFPPQRCFMSKTGRTSHEYFAIFQSFTCEQVVPALFMQKSGDKGAANMEPHLYIFAMVHI